MNKKLMVLLFFVLSGCSVTPPTGSNNPAQTFQIQFFGMMYDLGIGKDSNHIAAMGTNHDEYCDLITVETGEYYIFKRNDDSDPWEKYTVSAFGNLTNVYLFESGKKYEIEGNVAIILCLQEDFLMKFDTTASLVYVGIGTNTNAVWCSFALGDISSMISLPASNTYYFYTSTNNRQTWDKKQARNGSGGIMIDTYPFVIGKKYILTGGTDSNLTLTPQ